MGASLNLELACVAERLSQEFTDLPSTVVIDVVCSCAGECAAAGPFFIEQAARAQLVTRRHPQPAPVEPPALVVPIQPGPAMVADAT